MINKIKTFLMVAVMGFAMAGASAALVPATGSAADGGGCSPIANAVSKGANGAAGGNASSDCGKATGVDEGSITAAARKIVNLISIVVGIVAVIMIIFGGFRYITSGGDSGKVGNAKNSLIYAIVGLIIVALAQLIVRFVLNQSGEITS